MKYFPLDYFVKTKQHYKSFPTVQFHIHKHEISARWYGNKNWGGLIMYVKQGAT